MSSHPRVPWIHEFSLIEAGLSLHVCERDCALLARLLGQLEPNLDAFAFGRGFTLEERLYLLAIRDALARVAAGATREGRRPSRRVRDEEVTAQVAASELGLTPQRIGQLRLEGKVQGRHVGGRLRVTRASLEAEKRRRIEASKAA